MRKMVTRIGSFPCNLILYYLALVVPPMLRNLTSNFVSLQDGRAAMVRMVLQVHQDYLENQEYQATPDCLVLGLLGKLGLLVRTVHLANLGQKVLIFD